MTSLGRSVHITTGNQWTSPDMDRSSTLLFLTMFQQNQHVLKKSVAKNVFANMSAFVGFGRVVVRVVF